MPEAKPMYQLPTDFYEVQDYSCRADALAAGLPVGDYIPTDPLKGWMMTKEKALAIPGVQTFLSRGEMQIIFPAAFFGKKVVMGQVAVGITEVLVMPLDNVPVLNLLPEGSTSNVQGLGYSWPVPLKPFTAVQRLEQTPTGWTVHNLDVIPEVILTPGEQVIDRKCDRIIAKIGA